jgi:hypothetical protein
MSQSDSGQGRRRCLTLGISGKRSESVWMPVFDQPEPPLPAYGQYGFSSHST